MLSGNEAKALRQAQAETQTRVDVGDLDVASAAFHNNKRVPATERQGHLQGLWRTEEAFASDEKKKQAELIEAKVAENEEEENVSEGFERAEPEQNSTGDKRKRDDDKDADKQNSSSPGSRALVFADVAAAEAFTVVAYRGFSCLSKLSQALLVGYLLRGTTVSEFGNEFIQALKEENNTLKEGRALQQTVANTNLVAEETKATVAKENTLQAKESTKQTEEETKATIAKQTTEQEKERTKQAEEASKVALAKEATEQEKERTKQAEEASKLAKEKTRQIELEKNRGIKTGRQTTGQDKFKPCAPNVLSEIYDAIFLTKHFQQVAKNGPVDVDLAKEYFTVCKTNGPLDMEEFEEDFPLSGIKHIVFGKAGHEMNADVAKITNEHGKVVLMVSILAGGNLDFCPKIRIYQDAETSLISIRVVVVEKIKM